MPNKKKSTSRGTGASKRVAIAKHKAEKTELNKAWAEKWPGDSFKQHRDSVDKAEGDRSTYYKSKK